MTIIGIFGVGFVGGALLNSFKNKGVETYAYDKFKEINTFEECLKADIVFLCLPTQFCYLKNEYDKSAIYEVCERLEENKYKGLVVIKSTVEPGTTFTLCEKYKELKFIHNPEFLTAATANEDFENQSHIVLGKGLNVVDEELKDLREFYEQNYPTAELSICTALESESMKIYCNCFYSVKVQFFNELYDLCKKMECDYEKTVELMLKNNWINKMHTTVPGPDGKLSYGGYCFPKDTNALLNLMKKKDAKCKVLNATIEERNEMREDHVNCNL